MTTAKITPIPAIYIRGNKAVAELMGLPHIDMVTDLIKEGVLITYPRGNGRVFKVAECIRVAELIDQGIVKVKRNKKAA